MQIRKDALSNLGVELLVVFGSRARGSHQAGSDLDVGVLFQPGARLDPEAVDAVRNTLESAENLDLVCLNHAGPLLLNEVALDGEPRFENLPGAFERFRLRAFKRYMDTAKFRRAQAEALRELYG